MPPHHDLRQFGITVLDRVKDALVLDERAAPEGHAVAAAAVEPQQRIELIAEILDQERVSARPRNPEVEIPIGGAQRVVNARLKPGDLRLVAADALGERLDILGTHVPRRLPGGKALKDLAHAIDRLQHLARRLDDPRALVRDAGNQMALLQAVQGLAQGAAADTVALGENRLADLRPEGQLTLEDGIRQAMEKLLGQRLARLRGITDRGQTSFRTIHNLRTLPLHRVGHLRLEGGDEQAHSRISSRQFREADGPRPSAAKCHCVARPRSVRISFAWRVSSAMKV